MGRKRRICRERSGGVLYECRTTDLAAQDSRMLWMFQYGVAVLQALIWIEILESKSLRRRACAVLELYF